MKNASSTQIPGVQLADLPAPTLTETLEDVNKKTVIKQSRYIKIKINELSEKLVGIK
ncbi:TPA: hypothetical protein L9L30_004594 [Klebsiella quasipneumoniae subsp. quasipneumoniae]|nr:hypothetical protein [Klebsiella quasipneumoniae subsp. quasipneumoniae]